MGALLSVSRLIDGLNTRVGRIVYWAVLVAVLISAANALVRKIFNVSSNAYLEAQWYLFAAVFLLCAGYTLLHNEHVRIDVVVGRFSRRVHAWIDILGTLFFLLPMALMILILSWRVFVMAFASGEVSTNAGGLVLWPARLLMPVGFALLTLQGVSELIKRVAFLQGRIPYPGDKDERRAAAADAAGELAGNPPGGSR